MIQDPTIDPLAEDPLGPRMRQPWRELYELQRSTGAGVVESLQFTLGSRGNAMEIFESGFDGMVADHLLAGRTLQEARTYAQGSFTTITEARAGMMPRSSRRVARTDREWNQIYTVARELGLVEAGVEPLKSPGSRAFAESVAAAEDRGCSLGEAIAEARRTATRTPSTPTPAVTPPAAAPSRTFTTVADYQAAGLSEADARIALGTAHRQDR